MKKILILSANPTDTSQLRLGKEVQEIESGLERARKRDRFDIITKWATRPDDLRRALLDHNPQIVHFSGHGAGSQGLVLENDQGTMQLVSTDSLAQLFELFREQVECILLNACYSEVQAEAIHQHISCVVGMNQAITDKAAIKFVVGFYDALGADRTYEDAYKFGCNALELNNINGAFIPVLKIRQNSQPLISPENILLENPEGSVPLESAFYVERLPIETDCYETILKPGALIRIKAPRQMGKTSLLSRIIHHAQQNHYQTAYLNFQLADAEFFSSLDQFLQWFCASITNDLNLPDKLREYWQGVLGSKNKCTNYFQRYLLPTINNPIALCLDEVDEVFKHPSIATDFFGLLRAWHELWKNDPGWKNLKLVIAHSQEVYIPFNINQSPFNVGLPIELPELNQLQVKNLALQHQLNWTEVQIQELMNLVGGHPYLVRVALYEIARGRITLEKLQEVAPTEAGLYSDHLRRHLLNLQQDGALLAAFKRVLATDKPLAVGAIEAFKLRSIGLVKFQGNEVLPLCNLHRQYFRSRLGVNS